MSRIRRFDHVGITVADLDTVSAFFVELGFEVEGRTVLEGEFLDTVIGIRDSRTEIVMLRAPDGGAGLELARFIRPDHEPGSPAAMANVLGLRSVAFEVDDLQAIIERLAQEGYGLVGGIGEDERVWRMASVRGPEGILLGLAEEVPRRRLQRRSSWSLELSRRRIALPLVGQPPGMRRPRLPACQPRPLRKSPTRMRSAPSSIPTTSICSRRRA